MKSYDQYLKIVDGDGDQCGRGGHGGVDAAGAVGGAVGDGTVDQRSGAPTGNLTQGGP